MGSNKPRIGVTRCSKMEDYLESVRRAGGDPVELSEDEDPLSVVDRLDGVLLTGGLDVDPALYGQAAHPTTEIAAERDRFEVPLAQAAVAGNVPVFAICRGVQVLNVAGGGSLVQDIPSELETDVVHAVNEPKNHQTHSVTLTPGSTLATALATVPTEICAVNSRHHQAIARVAPGFVVSAQSPDGIVEAIERPASTFCVGVQWHPENFWRTGEFAGLFEAFVAAARNRRR